jgi:hypothetical protein
MLLIPKINREGNLTLDAYSYNSDEIDSVAFILTKAEISILSEILDPDVLGRFGLRFLIIAFEILKLERTLNLKFEGKEENTKISLGPNFKNASGGGPTSYKCSRIDTPPHTCETIYANDQKEAIVKCSLIAGTKNWLGGIPTPGYC